MILCNPHNPIGLAWDNDTLAQVARLAKKHGVIVISDEIHSDLVLRGRKHCTFANSCPEAEEVSITFGAPSKTFNIAGIVSSWCVIKNKELRKEFFEWMECNEFSSPNFMACIATEAAYNGKLAKDPMVREHEDAFVSRSKNLVLDRNEKIKKEYLQLFGLRDKNSKTFKSLGHKVYLHEVVCFLAYHYKDIISYHIHWNINQYGKAHSYERGYNYALDGQLISENDFFTEEGITEILPQLLTEEFERYPMTAKIPHFQAQITPNGNFKLSPKGIIYMYDAGEIADAQHGILRITLPWDKVEDILQ
jgi:hypothetical protein